MYPIRLKPHLLETLDVVRPLSADAYSALEAANETLVIRLLDAAAAVCARTGTKTLGPEQIRAALLSREFDFLALLHYTRHDEPDSAEP